MVASVYFIHNDVVQRVLTLSECIDAIEDAYREWDGGRAAIRARTNLYVYNLSEEETTRYNFTTIFSNNEGTGVQFAAVGSVIMAQLEKTGFAGIDKIPLDWFLQDIPD